MSDSVKLLFRTADGREFQAPAKIGLSVMEAAVTNNVPGIEAECGGSCMCATCHVYTTAAPLASPDEEESEMLEEVAAERRSESRLSCQIEVVAGLDGAIFDVPENQY